MLLDAVQHQTAFAPVYVPDEGDMAVVVILRQELVGQQLRQHGRMHVLALLGYHHLLHHIRGCQHEADTKPGR
ncbi:hypothetical protein D3C73_1552870 [compost metagenome]